MFPKNEGFSWRNISSNPVEPKVHAHLLHHTKSISRIHFGHQDGFLRDFVAGRRVLDIGCAEHDASHWESPMWQHAKLRTWAKTVIGLDILPSAVETLKKRGFDVICADATSEVDLGLRFERIVVGDVLEHVDNPVALLRFAIRHLEPGGLAVMRTPNPFWWKHCLRALREGIFIENAEHVSWITPCNALELAARAKAELVTCHLQMGRYARLMPGYWVLRALSRREPTLFAPAHLYTFRALP